MEYLRENEKVRKTVFACSYGVQVEYFKQKIMGEISWHCPTKFFWRKGNILYEDIPSQQNDFCDGSSIIN